MHDNFFGQVLAARTEDLFQAINEHNPHIVHFSGHGDMDHVALVDSAGNTKLVKKDAIVQLFKATQDQIQVVVFNTCLSTDQAAAVAEHIDVAIGMNDKIDDETARVFAARFYSAIGFGKSVNQAFEEGKAQVMLDGLPGEDIFKIYHRDEIDPSQIILVRPQFSSRQ
ncbi:MAG: CHAT domain-containing protein [Chloroflexota bacterium]